MSWIKTIAGAAAALVISASALSQDVGDSLDDFWDGVAENANATAPRADIGQEGGYFTGGSLVVRAPQETFRPVRMTAPSYRAGCGGIDIYTGGFGFVNSEQLVAMLRSIASNATGYAFQLALETVCPQCAEQMDKLNALAQHINSQNMDSCSAAQDIVNSMWPRHENAENLICSTTGTRTGQFSDWVAARHNCGSAGNRATEDGEAEAQSISNTNLAWSVLQESQVYRTPQGQRQAEFIMTLTGTLVVGEQRGDSGPDFHWYPPRAADEATLMALLYGGTLDVYRCTDSSGDCLEVQEVETTIPPEDGMHLRTRQLIEGILEKIMSRAEEGLSAEERDFLNMSSIPVHKILSVSYAYYGENAATEVPRLAEYIAVDLLTVHLDNMMNEAFRARPEVEFASAGESYENWREGVRETQRALRNIRQDVAERSSYSDDVVDNYRTIEAALARRMEVRMARGLRRSRHF